MAARKLIQDNGFLVVSNVFSLDDINSFRRELGEFLKRPNQNQNAGGITIPDFMIHQEFKETKQIINNAKINSVNEKLISNRLTTDPNFN